MKFHHTASVVPVAILCVAMVWVAIVCVAMAPASVKADSLRMMVQSVPEAGAKCLDAHDLVPGTGMRIWGCNNTVAQILSYDETSQELKIGGLCIESRGRGDPQDAVGLGNCNGGANQHWRMVETSGNYRIVGGNDLCIAIKGADTADGAPLNIENCQDRANQRWLLVEAPAVVVDAPAVEPSAGSTIQPRPPGTYGEPSPGTPNQQQPTTGQSQAAKTEGQPNSNQAPAPPASNSTDAGQHTASLTPSGQHASGSQSTTRRSSRYSKSRATARSASSAPPAQPTPVAQPQGGGFGGGLVGFGGFGFGFGHRSDIRLKEDIVPLGRLGNGIGLYRFRYKGTDHTVYVGVMAQEVQKIVPRAVSRDRDGFLRVDYDQLGIGFMTWNDYVARGGRDMR
jgi:hypothetical protein